MTVFFAGSEPDILNSFSGTISTNTNVALAGINRAAMSFAGTSQFGSTTLPAVNEGWFHARFFRTGNVGDFTYFDVLNVTNGSVTLFRIQSTPNGNLGTTILAGARSNFHNTTTAFAGDFDVHFKFHATDGFVRIYINQSLHQEVTGNTIPSSGPSNTAALSLRGPAFSTSTSYQFQVSNFLLADTPTLGARVHTLPLTVSTPNQWTGTPTDVTGTSSLGIISETTVDEEINFAAADLATAIRDGYRIEAVVVSNRSQFLTGSAVTKLQARTRIGGTPYNLDTEKALSTGYLAYQHIANVDPSTSAAWTTTNVNGAEFSLQAKA